MSIIPSWLIISLVMLVALIVLLKSVNHVYFLSMIKNNFFYFFIVAVFIFIAISLTHIHSTYDIDLTSAAGIGQAAKIYWNWAATVFSNIGKVTSYAIKQDWTNVTNSTK